MTQGIIALLLILVVVVVVFGAYIKAARDFFKGPKRKVGVDMYALYFSLIVLGAGVGPADSLASVLAPYVNIWVVPLSYIIGLVLLILFVKIGFILSSKWFHIEGKRNVVKEIIITYVGWSVLGLIIWYYSEKPDPKLLVQEIIVFTVYAAIAYYFVKKYYKKYESVL